MYVYTHAIPIMNIVIVHNEIIPVQGYGGTERVIWYLGKELVKLGHTLTFLVKEGSYCPFANVLFINKNKDILTQIPVRADVVHFNFIPDHIEEMTIPYLVTMHGNVNTSHSLDLNTVFVSRNHANRYGSNSFVYNGLDWNDYIQPDLNLKREYFHFLAKAAWRIKNVTGAIDVIKKTESESLKVLGGVRFNFKMGWRFTFSTRVQFYGMVNDEKKAEILNRSKGLLFPVRWHEPFGLSIIESLFYGCPVFGTPYGSLPEIIKPDVGYLSNKKSELVDAIKNWDHYSNKHCHEYALDSFNSKKMALSYLEKYEIVLANKMLNPTAPKLIEIQNQKFLDWD